jgi:hypothetical protein
LEGELGAEGVEALQAQLRSDSAKREAFVRLCLTASALIEAVSEGTASGTDAGADLTELDAQTESPRSNDLNETMVLPVLTGDEVDPDELVAMVLPPAPATPQAQPVSVFRRRWFWAASIIVPLLVGLAVYRLMPRPPSAVTVAVVASQPRQHESAEPVRIAPPPSFASVASTVNARWGGSTAQLLPGQRLPDTVVSAERFCRNKIRHGCHDDR